MSFGSPLLQAFANATRRQPPPPMTDQPTTEAAIPVADDNSEPAVATAPTVPLPIVGKRRLQCISTKATKVRVLNWMQVEFDQRGHDQNLLADAVRQFPEVFRQDGGTVNIMKVGRWWAIREELFKDFEWDVKSLSHSINGWRKRVELKARPGRGSKTSPENEWLYPLVRSDFERLRKGGVKFSPGVLLHMARTTLLRNPHPTFGPHSILGNSGHTLLDRIPPRWVQQFQESQGIVHRSQTGKLQVSPEKTEYIERSTAYHMGQLARGFASGELNEDLIENMDETHFVVNMDNGKTLGFRGDTEVKYADVVSGGIGITMVVKVTGGRAAKISTPMLIFQNVTSSYPIRSTPDNIPGVCYRSSPSSFMTSDLLAEYYNEPRVSLGDPRGRTKIQYIDNYPGHNVSPACTATLSWIRTQLRYFPANSTHLTQPCDSFVISKIKDAWRSRWDTKKMEMIGAAMWQGDGQDGTSGQLKNPGWSYFLQLAVDSVRAVNNQRDSHYDMSYARKAMICCGLSLNLDGQWDVKMLTPKLQEIIAKYRVNFEGSTEGLTPGPRPLRRQAVGSGRGRGRATASTEGGPSFGGGRGRGRGRSAGAGVAGGPPVVPVSGGLLAEDGAGPTLPSSIPVVGPTVAEGWVSTRPGARAHRRAARQACHGAKSSFFSVVHSAFAEIILGESSVAGDGGMNEDLHTSTAFQDAQGLESVDIDVVLDAVAELTLPPEVFLQ